MNTLQATMGALSASTLLALLLGCEPSNESLAATPVPGTRPVEAPRLGSANAQAENVDMGAVDRLAAAGCDHEQNCVSIGSGQTYPSRQACLDRLSLSLRNQLSGYCAQGIARDGLEKCASALRTEDCNHPLQALVHEDHCSTSVVCAK